jgi:NAD(P)-dependent dehydrogenase (short-subunit alcohol dehydrogenase family)
MKLAGLRVVLGGSFGLGLAVAKAAAPQNATGVIASKQAARKETL